MMRLRDGRHWKDWVAFAQGIGKLPNWGGPERLTVLKKGSLVRCRQCEQEFLFGDAFVGWLVLEDGAQPFVFCPFDGCIGDLQTFTVRAVL